MPRFMVLWLVAGAGAGCYESHAPEGEATPDAGLGSRPDGGVPGECLPGEAMLRGTLSGSPSGSPLREYRYAVARHQHGPDCVTSVVSFALTEVPPAGRSTPDSAVSVRAYLPDGTDLYAASEPFVGDVHVELHAGSPFITSIDEGATLRADPVELGSGRVTLDIAPGHEVWGRIDAVYCSSSTCL